MASAPDGADDVFDRFLAERGHDTETTGWRWDGRKKQCPECRGLHDPRARFCTVCGWVPPE